MAEPTRTPLFTFGLIADVQYADIDDKLDFEQLHMRHYRQALVALRQAVQGWNARSGVQQVSFILQLGDLIDGMNRRINQSQIALDKTLAELQSFNGMVHHTFGNHELYNFSRKTLLNSPMNSAPTEDQRSQRTKSYYAFSPHPDFLVIILDTFSASMLGYEPTDPEYRKSSAFLAARNFNSGWNDPSGRDGVARRFCMFNGALDQEQLHWLEDTLKIADNAGQKVVIAGHQPMFPGSCDPKYLCWNYTDVLAVLHKYSCVLAYFCGHDHTGGVCYDEHGIHHITLPGAIEGEPGHPDYGIVEVYQDCMELQGHGRVPNVQLAQW